MGSHTYHTPHCFYQCHCQPVTSGEDGEVIEPGIFRWPETHYLGPPKVEGIEDSGSEQEDEKQGQDQTRKELILIALKEAQYVKNDEYANNRNELVGKISTFPYRFVATAPHPFQKLHRYKIMQEIGDEALRLTIGEYHLA